MILHRIEKPVAYGCGVWAWRSIPHAQQAFSLLELWGENFEA